MIRVRAGVLFGLLAFSACAGRSAPAPATAEAPSSLPSEVAAGVVGGEADAAAVAEALAGLMASRLPPGGAAGALSVKAAAGDALLGPALENALRRRGYAVTADGRHALTYYAGPLDKGSVVARLTVDNRTRMARAFARAAGRLQPAGNGVVMLAADGGAW